eukprot:scaffold78365_cov63-Phaeocystis_antarctica.AAC.2
MVTCRGNSRKVRRSLRCGEPTGRLLGILAAKKQCFVREGLRNIRGVPFHLGVCRVGSVAGRRNPSPHKS